MKPTALLALVVPVALFTLVPTAFAQHAPPAGAPAAAVSLSDTARVRRWRDDLRFITSRVRAQHPRPFFRGTEAAFDSAARAIEARIATTDDMRLAVECMRMVALLRDGHTQVIGTLPPLGFTSVLPVFLRPFEDGLYVVAADAANADAVGSKVTRIGDVTPEVALERVLSMASGDNRFTKLDRAPLFMMMPGVLNALGISSTRDRIVLETETVKKRRKVLTVAAGAPPAGFPFEFLATEPRFPEGWSSARTLAKDGPPRCDRRPEDAWWFEDLPGTSALYLRMREVARTQSRQANAEDSRRFFQRLFAHADSMRPAVFVIDLRHNHGGNNGVVDALIRGIAERPWLNREGVLFAIIDRGTFSAAMNAAVFLDHHTRVTFVGEPTGGGLNHYGDASQGNTPNFGMMCQVSTIPWLSRWPMDPTPWIAPDVAVPSTFANWRTGRDVELDAVLEAARTGTRDQQVLSASKRGGAEAAAAAFAEWTRVHPNPWARGVVDEMATSISERLDRAEWADAAALGEALVKLEPQSAPAWRFAGEAHLMAGNRARGIQCLREALRLNPQAQVSRRILESIGEKP